VTLNKKIKIKIKKLVNQNLPYNILNEDSLDQVQVFVRIYSGIFTLKQLSQFYT
jgi:hypothetical protein